MNSEVLQFTEKRKTTAHFECDLDIAGFIILNMPIEEWRKMGKPLQLLVTVTPITPKQAQERLIAKEQKRVEAA